VKKKEIKKEAVIYQVKKRAIELRGGFDRENILATQAQIAEVFNVTPQNIIIHLKNVFKDIELDPRSICKDFLQVQIEGK